MGDALPGVKEEMLASPATYVCVLTDPSAYDPASVDLASFDVPNFETIMEWQLKSSNALAVRRPPPVSAQGQCCGLHSTSCEL